MKLPTWLFIIALCIVSCSDSPSSRIEASRTQNPQQFPTAIVSPQAAVSEPTDTPEPIVVTTATPQAPAGPDAAEILTKAMAMMGSIGTFHFALDRQIFSENGAEELIAHIPVNGKFNDPDQIEGTIILAAKDKKAILDFIIIGEELYLREQNSDAWQLLDWHSQAAQTVRENAFLPMEQFSMDNLHTPVLVGEARLGGLPVYHVRGELGKLAEGQSEANENSIEFWIGKDNYLIYRVISELVATGTDEIAVHDRTVVQVDYARFGDPVLIVAPKVDTSGGYRPTGSYPTDELLNEIGGESIPVSPDDQQDVPGQDVDTGTNLDGNAQSGDKSLN
jgi:hypothetical protein